jgi:hypothetical protein
MVLKSLLWGTHAVGTRAVGAHAVGTHAVGAHAVGTYAVAPMHGTCYDTLAVWNLTMDCPSVCRSLPAINDITAMELRSLLSAAAVHCPLVHAAWHAGMQATQVCTSSIAIASRSLT